MLPISPERRSRYPVEPKPPKYVIPFAPELVDLILAGEKVMIYRYNGTGKYEYLNVGDEINIQNNGTGEIVAPGVVTDKEKTTFLNLPLDRPGHEPYTSKEEQRDVFSGYYEYLNRRIKDSDPFLILGFQLRLSGSS